MRTIIAHILLAAVLLQLLPAQQLCKVPVLFEHFYEHQQRDPGISIGRFMAMHYLGEDDNDDDTDRDMQLPFKKVNHQHVIQYQCCVPVQQLVFRAPISWNTPVSYPLLSDPALPHGCIGALFRPPIV
jgi:hypothetical protein